VRFQSLHTVCLIAGTLIGVILGDRVFPELDAAFGDPVTDIFFGIVGTVFAAIGYEIVAVFLRPE
jgi:hypothetical protein